MSQSDYVLNGNGGGGSVLTDIDGAIKAAASSNSGTTEPTTTFPGMTWADEQNLQLKIRSSDNSRWWVIGSLNEESLGLGAAVGDYLISSRGTINKHAICDGTEISRTNFSELFALIGTSFGDGNGTTTFNLPDVRDKAIVFPNSDSTKGDIRNLGDSFGESRHTMTESELVPHVHAYRRRNAGTQSGTPGALFEDNNGSGYQSSQAGVLIPTGGGNPFNVIQKSLVIGNLFIKVTP